jgi:hypothetical protein
MKHFTDRLFYCEGTDTLAHVMYISPKAWAMSTLRPSQATGEWRWGVDAITGSYEGAYSLIRRDNPTLLMQEERWG